MTRLLGQSPAGLSAAVAAERAQVSLQKAQTTAVYAGLNLWPAATTAALVRSQVLEDGVYPGAGAELGAIPNRAGQDQAQAGVADAYEDQPRDPQGRWAEGGRSSLPWEQPTPSGFTRNALVPKTVFGTEMKLAASADDPQGLKMARDAATAAGLNRRQRRAFDDAITGQGITDYQGLLLIALSIKQGQIP